MLFCLVLCPLINVYSSLVYPSGGMLEMSNGYPSSPLNQSPSPSPGLGGHHSNKCKSEAHHTNSIRFCVFVCFALLRED
jgi:hypothetical protein